MSRFVSQSGSFGVLIETVPGAWSSEKLGVFSTLAAARFCGVRELNAFEAGGFIHNDWKHCANGIRSSLHTTPGRVVRKIYMRIASSTHFETPRGLRRHCGAACAGSAPVPLRVARDLFILKIGCGLSMHAY